jgi:hypothetical protein
LLVYFDEPNNRYILVDGFHRFEAHRRLHPNDAILVKLELGTLDDARWASLGVNKSHGLRRTNADKRNAIVNALKHPKGTELSDRQIAEHVGVHHDTVRRIRKELELTGEIRQSNSRTGQDGRTINIANIGSRQSSQESELCYKTCSDCRYFEDDKCADGTEKLPFDAACSDWAVRVVELPEREIPPPDYENVEPCDDEDDTPVKHHLFQNRRLKNCITVHLPPDNPQLFAVELREHCEREYLIACLAALKHLLEDDDD